MRTAAALATILVLSSWQLGPGASVARADAPGTIQLAIPSNVEVIVGSTQVHVIGRPTSVGPVNCAPGTPFPQSALILDPGGAHASQISGALFFHDHEIANGTRFQVTGGPNLCNTDFKLYTGTLE